MSHAASVQILVGLETSGSQPYLCDQAQIKALDLKAWVHFLGWQYSKYMVMHHCWERIARQITPLGEATGRFTTGTALVSAPSASPLG